MMHSRERVTLGTTFIQFCIFACYDARAIGKGTTLSMFSMKMP